MEYKSRIKCERSWIEIIEHVPFEDDEISLVSNLIKALSDYHLPRCFVIILCKEIQNNMNYRGTNGYRWR